VVQYVDAGHPFTPDPEAFLRDMEAYSARGISLVELANVGPDPLALVRAPGPLVPRPAVLGSSGCA